MDTLSVQCPRCLRHLSVAAFHKNKSKKNGLQTNCKECKQAIHLEYRERHPYPRKTPLPDKTLTKKEKDHLYYIAHRDEIIARVREYSANNKEKISDKGRNYRQRNLERLKAYRRRWYVDNREKSKDYSRAYYQSHKEEHAEYGREWRKNNPEKVRVIGRASMNRRRALLMSAEGQYTAKDAKAQYERQKGQCYWCDKYVGSRYDLDHIVPLTRGGSNYPDNIVVACPHCNRSRRNKLPHEWKIGGKLL